MHKTYKREGRVACESYFGKRLVHSSFHRKIKIDEYAAAWQYPVRMYLVFVRRAKRTEELEDIWRGGTSIPHSNL